MIAWHVNSFSLRAAVFSSAFHYHRWFSSSLLPDIFIIRWQIVLIVNMKWKLQLHCHAKHQIIASTAFFFRAISHFCFLLLARNVSHSNCIFAAVERNNWTNEKEISVRHQIFLWCWGRNKQCAWLLLLSSFSKQIIHVCVIQFASSVRWNTLCLHVLLHFVDTWIVLTISVTNEWSENNQRIHTDNARQCWSNGCIFDWFFGDCANN